jgi:glycerol-3-phosphate cytidylyltransferase
MTTIITFGTFDLTHVGHINILRRIKQKHPNCYLVVGVSTDKFNYIKKQKYPVFNQHDRKKILESLIYVDKVFFEESMEQKREYILRYNAKIMYMGDDWKAKMDEYNDICEVIYLPRTPDISTTDITHKIKKEQCQTCPNNYLNAFIISAILIVILFIVHRSS